MLAVLFPLACRLAKRNTYIVFEVIAKTGLLTVSALIMVTCCTFIGMTLLKMTMTSCNKIARNNIMELSNQNCNLSKSTPAQETVSKTSAKGTKKITRVLLLFVITVVFVACWLPLWLRNIGVYVFGDVAHLLVVNSVVNPFIYGVASAMFREDVRQFYRQTRSKLSACYT